MKRPAPAKAKASGARAKTVRARKVAPKPVKKARQGAAKRKLSRVAPEKPVTTAFDDASSRPTPKRPAGQPRTTQPLVPIHHFHKPSLIEAPAVTDVRGQVHQALSAMRAIETLESAYAAWAELKNAVKASTVEFDAEQRRLEDQGALLLGAMRNAEAAPAHGGSAIAARTELQQLHQEAQQALEKSKAALVQQRKTVHHVFDQALIAVRRETRRRIAIRAQLGRPKMKLMVRTLGADQRILHLERPSPEAAVLLAYALSGRIPSRFDAVFDDATEDMQRDAQVLYAEEGVAEDETRADAQQLKALINRLTDVLPMKGVLLQPMPDAIVRWKSRGPILEAEIESGQSFRNILSAAEAEKITGHLLSLKLKGALDLELVRG